MLRYLFNFFFPFLMLTFAAGATIGDVGADAGGGDGADGGADSGGADDSGSTDSGADSDEGVSNGDETDEGIDSDATDDDNADGSDNQPDPNALVDLGDGRQVPAKFKKLFDLAKKAGVEKEAKQLYFAQQRLTKAIPGGINAAIELANTVEELGGVEGIESLQSDIETFRADADLFESGDPKWIETGFQESPEAALKMFAHSLDFVADNHPDHYNHLMAKVIVNDLSNLDVREIYNTLNAIKDNPRAKELAKQLADYYNARVETSRQAPEKKPDAADAKLTAREKAVEKREMDSRFADVNREVFPELKSSVGKALQSEAKTRGVDLEKISKEFPGEWRDLLNDIHQRIMQEARKDQRFLDKHFALVKKGDLKRAADAINKKHQRIIDNTDVIKEAVDARGLFRKKGAGGDKNKDKGNRPGAGNNNDAQNAGWQRVSARPANSEINWSKTTQAMQIDGKYILNDGKKVIVKY